MHHVDVPGAAERALALRADAGPRMSRATDGFSR